MLHLLQELSNGTVSFGLKITVNNSMSRYQVIVAIVKNEMHIHKHLEMYLSPSYKNICIN